MGTARGLSMALGPYLLCCVRSIAGELQYLRYAVGWVCCVVGERCCWFAEQCRRKLAMTK